MMLRRFAAAAVMLLSVACSLGADVGKSSGLAYPPAPQDDTVDDYHGTKVADPYRPLGRPRLRGDAGLGRGREQSHVRLSGDDPRPRAARRDRLTKLWDYEKFGMPLQEGGRYFYTRNSGLQNQSVLYYRRSARQAEPQVLLDPNNLVGRRHRGAGRQSISDDGKLLAYALADAGSDWLTWQVRDVGT